MGKMYLNGILYGIENRFRYDLLLENTNFTPTSGTSDVTRTYTLQKSIDEYDALAVFAFMLSNTTTRNQVASMLIMNQDFYLEAPVSTDYVFLLNGTLPSVTRRLGFRFSDSTHIITKTSGRADTEEPRLWKVYGLKFPSNDAAVPAFLNGTSAPSYSVGESGNLFVQTDINNSEIDNIYFKIGNTWIPMMANGNIVGY